MAAHSNTAMTSVDDERGDFDAFVRAAERAHRRDMESTWLKDRVERNPPPSDSPPLIWSPSPEKESLEPVVDKNTEWRRASWWSLNSRDDHQPEQDYGMGHSRNPNFPTSGMAHDFSRTNAARVVDLQDGWVPDEPMKMHPRALVIPDDYPSGNATLTYAGPDGQLAAIPNLNIDLIGERSALLATAFEETRSGPKLNLGTLCPMTAMPLVRFLYCGDYAESDVWQDVPTSLLLHCKMYHLGNIYDLPELKTQAYLNILRQCEFGCSSPDKPIDLCQAISFAFDNLHGVSEVTESILHYCVSCFLSHQLGSDPNFTSLAYNNRPFHQDLMKVCRDRGYDDDSAAAIIQMPYKPFLPETYASTEHPAIARFEDLIYHFHGDDDRKPPEDSPSKRKRAIEHRPLTIRNVPDPIDPPLPPTARKLPITLSSSRGKEPQHTSSSFNHDFKFTLPMRTRTPAPRPNNDNDDNSSASEDDGLCIGKKRRVPTVAEVPSRSLLSGSDSDYEVVSGPASVKSASEDSGEESDTGTLVDVPKIEWGGRGGDAGPASRTIERSSNGGDGSEESEWDLV